MDCQNGRQRKIVRPMIIYKPYTIVKVPFPFTDKEAAKMRPALIISNEVYAKKAEHYILAMITTAQHSAWHNDIRIPNHQSAGLPVPSVIRWKLFSLDVRLVMGQVGKLDEETCHAVANNHPLSLNVDARLL